MPGERRSPVRLEASRDEHLSRWLWLVKWVLAVPHYLVLVFLWPVFLVLSVGAFFAILFTGRYPRALFDFNVGVMRWTWRVQHYAYGALGTDRYPPFTLRDVPDYPAHLDVAYPERLSRGLVLVKWWLLALPHYVIVGLFLGGAGVAVREDGAGALPWVSGGLVGILVLVAGVALVCTGRYPPPIYDFVLGMDRWAVRVAAYAGLMTDAYPPFRLDPGGSDPEGPSPATPPSLPPADPAASWPVAPAASPGTDAGWTAGRVAAALTGSVLAFTSLGVLAAGGGLLWADRTARDGDGYISAPARYYEAAGNAIATARIELHAPDHVLTGIQDFTGTVRFRVTPSDPAREVFLGIARADDVGRYLAGVPYTAVGEAGAADDATDHPGSATPPPPAQADFWTVSTQGAGAQDLTWEPTGGEWVAVAMNADASAGVNATTRVAATLPGLPWVAAGLLVLGALLLAGGLAFLLPALIRASREGAAPAAAVADAREPSAL